VPVRTTSIAIGTAPLAVTVSRPLGAIIEGATGSAIVTAPVVPSAAGTAGAAILSTVGAGIEGATVLAVRTVLTPGRAALGAVPVGRSGAAAGPAVVVPGAILAAALVGPTVSGGRSAVTGAIVASSLRSPSSVIIARGPRAAVFLAAWPPRPVALA